MRIQRSSRARLELVLAAHALFALLSWNACLAAEPADEASHEKKSWELEVFPYAWIVGSPGTELEFAL